MGRLVEESGDRAAVNRALITLCLERGFRELEIGDLAAQAGVDEAELERDYGSLEQILVGTFAEELQRFHERADPYMESDLPWADRVRGVAYELMRFLQEDLDATRFLVLEVRAGGEEAMLLFGQELGRLIDLVDEGRQELEDPDSVSRSTAEQIAGGLFNQLYGMVTRGPLPEEADLIPQLMYATVLPYLGEEGASRELRVPPPPPGAPPQPGEEAALYSSRVPERGRGDGGGDGGALLGPLPSGRHGLSPEQVAESQRERLLAAAAEIVAEHGYKATTIAAIAKRASVANRAFYDNFENKEACVWAAIEAVLDHARQRIVAAMSPIPDWTQRIVAGLREVLSFFTEEPELARLCLVVPLASTPGIATKYSNFVKFALPLLAAGRAERSENASLPAATEDQVLGGLLSLMARASNGGEQRLDGLLPDLARFTLAPYIGEKRAGEAVGSLPD